MFYFSDALTIIGGYLIGSVSFAVVVCRALKLPDPRTRGSRNPGATNVARECGKWPATLTLFGDVAKAVMPMLLVRVAGFSEITVGLVGFATFMGHLYPLYYSFNGGKGIATFLGILVVLQWQTALVWSVIWLLVVLIFRYVSVASIVATLVVPFYAWWSMQAQWLVVLVSLMALFILLRHRSNIRNLLNHREKKVNEEA